MKHLFAAVTLVTLIVFASCARKTNPAASTAEAPKPRATSYTADISPLIQSKCSPCHLPSKGGFKANFETYAGAKKYAADMVSRVLLNPGDKGFMPFKHDKLPEAEIAVFKKWVADGTLEN